MERRRERGSRGERSEGGDREGKGEGFIERKREQEERQNKKGTEVGKRERGTKKRGR